MRRWIGNFFVAALCVIAILHFDHPVARAVWHSIVPAANVVQVEDMVGGVGTGGTGFAVATPKGGNPRNAWFITAWHVVSPPGKVSVRIPGSMVGPLPASAVYQAGPNDFALIEVPHARTYPEAMLNIPGWIGLANGRERSAETICLPGHTMTLETFSFFFTTHGISMTSHSGEGKWLDTNIPAAQPGCSGGPVLYTSRGGQQWIAGAITQVGTNTNGQPILRIIPSWLIAAWISSGFSGWTKR